MGCSVILFGSPEPKGDLFSHQILKDVAKMKQAATEKFAAVKSVEQARCSTCLQ